ncbi:hypothetical protein BRC68_16050, partial [Halobacteriales archaeon QH_6_64_20]
MGLGESHAYHETAGRFERLRSFNHEEPLARGYDARRYRPLSAWPFDRCFCPCARDLSSLEYVGRGRAVECGRPSESSYEKAIERTLIGRPGTFILLPYAQADMVGRTTYDFEGESALVTGS